MKTIKYTNKTVLYIRVIAKFLKIINSKLNFCIINNRTITEFLNHLLHFINVELQSRILNFISFNLINNSKLINNSISISKSFKELSLQSRIILNSINYFRTINSKVITIFISVELTKLSKSTINFMFKISITTIEYTIFKLFITFSTLFKSFSTKLTHEFTSFYISKTTSTIKFFYYILFKRISCSSKTLFKFRTCRTKSYFFTRTSHRGFPNYFNKLRFFLNMFSCTNIMTFNTYFSSTSK